MPARPKDLSLPPAPVTRRDLIRGIGGLAAVATLPAPAWASGSTEALLLSCMDYRLVDDIVRYMEGRGLTNKYDHAVLAGAALGALQQKKRAWGATFWEHVDVAIQLHSIHKVIVMDHRDCGAYRVFLGEKAVADVASETKVHTAKLRELGKAIRRKHRKIEVELLLMDLQGQVEVIPA